MAKQHDFEPLKLAVAVDTVVFGYSEGELYILLIERGLAPFRGAWALPGGFVREDENLEQAAKRELKEEASIEPVYLEQLYTYGEPKRDPRYRVLSVAYYALVRVDGHTIEAGTDAKRAKWFPISEMPKLAFDHADISKEALRRLRAKVRYQPLAFNLLPVEFTLLQLQIFFEAVLGKALDKRNFRKKILGYGFLKEGRKLVNVNFRAPSLYRFDSARYARILKSGEPFDI